MFFNKSTTWGFSYYSPSHVTVASFFPTENIPKFVTHLKADVLLEIPSHITHLEYILSEDSYSVPTLPPSTKKLELGGYFNQKISSLPPFLTHMTFGNVFNQNISHILPSSITHLTFGIKFNHPIITTSLLNLQHLTVGDNFNQPLESTFLLSLFYHLDSNLITL
jgi:FNIP Repeat